MMTILQDMALAITLAIAAAIVSSSMILMWTALGVPGSVL
jgi:hypothetical protein